MRACCPSGGHRPCRGQTIPGGEEDPVTCRPESLLPGFKCLLQSLADQTGRGVGPRTFALRHSVRDSLVDGPGRDAGLGVHARRFVLAPGRDRWLCERRRADIAPQPARIRPESAGERATGTGRGQSEAGPPSCCSRDGRQHWHAKRTPPPPESQCSSPRSLLAYTVNS